MPNFNAQYILSGSVRRQLDLLVNTQLQGALASFLGQTATVVGTASVDSVYARAGVSVDFTGSGASVDTLYLDGALSDYVITATASVVTLTRAASGNVPASTYKLSIESVVGNNDSVIFSNGAAGVAALVASVAASPVAVVLDTSKTSLTSPLITPAVSGDIGTTRVRLDTAGTLIATASDPLLVISGSAGVDTVYVNAGSQVDAQGLGGSTDRIFMTGSFGDYTKTIVGKTVQFSRTIGGQSEKVIVSTGSGMLNDQLFFADGNVTSNKVFTAMTTAIGNLASGPAAAAVALLTLSGVGGTIGVNAQKTALDVLAEATLTTLSADSNNATDWNTSTAAQTINGTYVGYLRTGDKIQVQLTAGGPWVDAVATPTSTTGGTFSYAGVTLAAGSQSISVRTVGLESGQGAVTNPLNPTNNTNAGNLIVAVLDQDGPSGTLAANGSGLAADAFINANESMVTLEVSTADLQVGDTIQLKDGSNNLGALVTVTANDKNVAGKVLLTVSRASLTEGAHSITAVFSDQAGNTSTSVAYPLEKDTEIPTVASAALSTVGLDGTTLLSATEKDAYLNISETQSVVKVTASSSAGEGFKVGDLIQITKAGINLGSAHAVTVAEAAAGIVYLGVNKTDLVEGANALNIKASDAAGNTTSTTSTITITRDDTIVSPVLRVSTTAVDGVTALAQDAVMDGAETEVVLVVEPLTSVTFKAGDTVQLFSVDSAGVKTALRSSSASADYPTVTIAADGDKAYFTFLRADLPTGSIKIEAHINDVAANTATSGILTLTTGLTITNSAMVANSVTALDVNSDIILVASADLGTAVAGKKIKFTNTAAANGFSGENQVNTFEVDAGDTRFVTIDSLNPKLIKIKPPFDFDFGNSYTITIDDGAFKDTAGVLGNSVVSSASGLNFGTVAVGADKANAIQGQILSAADGTVSTTGKKWFTVDGQGDFANSVALDVSGGDYALVMLDRDTDGASYLKNDGVGVFGTNLDIDKWGTGDLIYVDDQSNNLAKINHKSSSAITPGSSSSSGLVSLQTIRFDQAAGVANPGYINIISTETPGGSLAEADLLNQLHIANTRYGKEVSLSRTDSVSADPLMVGSNITSLTPAVFEVSTTGLRVGDVIKLVFVDNNGVTTALTTPISYTVISGDVTAGKASVSVGDLSGLTSGTTYTMAAQLTDRDGAVSLSTPVSLSYVSSVATPTLSLGSASNDLTLDPSENDIELFVSGSTLNVGDKVAIQLAGSTITTTTSATSTVTSGVVTVTAYEIANGITFTVPKTSLGNNINSVTAKVTDGLTQTASSTALSIDVPQYVGISGIVGAGPVIAGNDLVATAYDTNGNVLGVDTGIDPTTGYSIQIKSSYTGAVLIQITSAGISNDFVDENSGADTNLGSGSGTYTLRAVAVATGSAVTTNVTTLTDLAAQKMLGANALLASGVSTSDVTAINTAVASKFLGNNVDVTSLTPTFTVSAAGADTSASANRYGQVLKQLSDLSAANGGNINATQAALAAQVSWVPGQAASAATLTAQAQQTALLAKVALNAKATSAPTGVDALTVSDLTDLGVAGAADLTAARQTELLAKIVGTGSAAPLSVAALQTSSNKIASTGKILDLADGLVSPATLTLADYANAGVLNVTAANLAAVNIKIAASDSASLATLQAISTAATAGATANAAALAKIAGYTGLGTASPTVAEYADAGVTGVDAVNLTAVNARVALIAPGAIPTASQLQTLATAGAAAQNAAYIKLVNYSIDPSNAAPTLAVFRDAGVIGVTSEASVDAAKALLSTLPPSASISATAFKDQVTAAVLPTLQPFQLAAISPEQISALTSAQISALKPAVVSGLAPAQVAALSAAQLGALSSSQVQALPTDVLSSLSTSQLAAVNGNLSSAQAQAVADIQSGSAISTVQAAALSSSDINALSPATLSGLTPAAFNSLSSGALGSLDSAQMAALTSAQAAAMGSAQISGLSDVQLAAMSPDAIASLGAAALGQLSTAQLAALTPVQVGKLTALQIDSLSAAQVADLAPSALANMTALALGSLSSAQVANVTALQIDALSPSQVSAISALAIAGLSTTAIGSFGAAQVAALSVAQLGALTLLQVQALPTEVLGSLSASQLGAISTHFSSAQNAAVGQINAAALVDTTAAAAISANDVNGYTPEFISGLTPAAIASLTAGALGSLDSAQLAAITTAQAASLTSVQVGVLSALQIADLSPAAFASLSVANMAIGQWANVTAKQVAAMTPAQFKTLSAAQVAAIPAAAVSSLSADAIQSLSVAQVAGLTSVQTAELTSAQVEFLSAAQVAALTPGAFDGLTDVALSHLNAAQAGALTAAQIDTLSTANLAVLMPSTLAFLSVSATASLDVGQVNSMSVAQLSALTEAQKAAMTAANQFSGLTVLQLQALNSAPTLSAGTLTAVSVSEDADNTTGTSLGLSGLTYSAGGAAEAAQTLSFSITSIPAFVTLWKADGVTQVTSATSGLSQADIQGLKYKTVADANGSGTITWTVTDSGNPPRTLTQSLNVTVSATDDAPTATNLSAAESYNEDTALDLTDIVVTDVDTANVTVTLTLSNVAAGALNTGTSGSVTSTYDSATGVWSASGAKANVNTLLAALTFTPALNFNGNFTIATSVSDGVNSAVTGSKAFTGTAVDDAPTLVQPSSLSFTNTSATDSFTNQTATLSATDVESSALTYGLTGSTSGSTTIGAVTYDQSKVGTYGTLYLEASTGNYVFVPNAAAINALTAAATESFGFSVSDGSLSATRTLTISVVDQVAPGSLDLDASASGVQTALSNVNDSLAVQSGVGLVTSVAAPVATDISSIAITLGGAGLDTANDKLVLDVDTSISASVTTLTGKTIGGITGLSYGYDSATKVLTIGKTDGSTISGTDVKSIVDAIKVKNASGTTGIRTAAITLTDAAANTSAASTSTVDIRTDSLTLDMDSSAAGQQRTSQRFALSSSNLSSGFAFLSGITAPTATDTTSITMVLSGAGLDVTNDKLVLDVDTAISANVAALTNKTIGGVSGLSYSYTSSTKTLTISKTSGGTFSGADVKAVMDAIKLKNTQASPLDGNRIADFSLASASTTGVTSTATISVDATAPVIDLDSGTVGVQSAATKNVSAAAANAGAILVDTSKLSVTLANDTQKIKIVMSGAALDTTHDKLVLDVDLDLGTTLASVSNKTIAGVSGLSYAYDSSTKALTISKTNNAVLSAAEAQTIIAGILFKDTSASLTSGNRIATITLEDAATNVSTAAVSTLVVDTLVPTSLASSLVVSTQKGFKIVSVGDIMGSSNTHNLASGETATLTSLIPSGFTGSSFLTALRGMAVEWGGFSITGNANTTDASYPTFKSFGSSGPTSGTAFDIFHQGGNFVKGENITFTGSASALTLTANSQFYVANKDVYDYSTSGGTKVSNSGYDIGNVKLLYQFDTGFQDTTPTIDVTYDGTKAQVGDVLQLFEGSTLLGSRVLTSSDVGSANTTRGVDVLNSLSFGNHNITTKFVDTAGATVTASNVAVNITSSGTPPTVTGLTVSADNGVTNVSLNDSLTSYAAVSSLNSYNVDKNLTFRGNVSADSVVSISMGGQQIAFASVTAGNFSIKAATNILKPGFYSDLSITVTDATSGVSQGQTTLFTDYKMGWYYGSQALGDVTGGAGNDNFILGTSTASSRVQTGAGNDIVTVGGFGLTSGLSKIISDFTVGTDTVKVNGQTVTSANLSNFVTASASGSDTRLVIDLDGAGAGATTYTLTLTGVTFNSANTATIFGI